MKLKYTTTTDVLDALKLIESAASGLKPAAARELGGALAQIWKSEGEPVVLLPSKYIDFSLSASGVARQIGMEFGLPGNFD